jgi:hypothetical protein
MTRRTSVVPRLPCLALLIAVCSLSVCLTPFALAQTVIKALPNTITEPGVYVLTKDLVYSGSGAAIDVETSNVVVDFQGYKIQGSSPSTAFGVTVGKSAVASNVTIQNGTVENFSVGVYFAFDGNFGDGGALEAGQACNLRIVNTGAGIVVDQPYSVIQNNLIYNCSGIGISGPDGVGGILIANNKLILCGTGVQMYGRCYLTGNAASNCTTGFDLEPLGGSAGDARFNTTTNCPTPFAGSGNLLTDQNG